MRVRIVNSICISGLVLGGVGGLYAIHRVHERGAVQYTSSVSGIVCDGKNGQVVTSAAGTRLQGATSVGRSGPALNPSDPKYDLSALQRAGVGAYDVFASEDRDAQWADVMEPQILQQLASDFGILLPIATNIGVTCHWTTCRLSADVAKDDYAKAERVLTIAQYGDSTSFARRSIEPLAQERSRVSGIVFFQKERDPSVQREAYARKREAFMSHMSSDRSSPFFGPLLRGK
jgi:hypothetical protein